VLYGFLGIDFKWVMKQEMRSIPGLGIGCEKVGHIFIDRSDHEAAMASIQSAQSKIVNGTSVVFLLQTKNWSKTSVQNLDLLAS
jgi:1-acyl-sn-glycerol-3-phosphate acyltransferase